VTSLEARREFFAEVRTNVRVLLGYDLLRGNPITPQFADEALDVAYPIFGEEWSTAVAPDITAIREDSERIVFAATALMEGGVPIGELESWCSRHGLDLERALLDTERRAEHDDLLRLHRATIVEAKRWALVSQ
jgi:hypothetical protein